MSWLQEERMKILTFSFHPHQRWDFHFSQLKLIVRFLSWSTQHSPSHKFNGSLHFLWSIKIQIHGELNVLSTYNHWQQLWVPDFIGLPIYLPLSLLLHVASLPYLALAPALPFPALVAGLLKRCPEKLLSRLPCPDFSPLPTFSYLPSPFRVPLLPGLPPKLPSLPLPSFPLLWSASRTLLPWVFPLSSLCGAREKQPTRWAVQWWDLKDCLHFPDLGKLRAGWRSCQ